MPSFEIIKESDFDKNSFRVASIIGTFDLQNEKIVERFAGNIDIENTNWQIGCIHGSSGTGKSVIAQELWGKFKEKLYFEKSVIDDLAPSSTDEIVKTLVSVGFGSTTSWLKPYKVLSNGEKMRVDLARALLSEDNPIVFDEFTSVVDRHIAKIGSDCVQRAIRSSSRKFIAITCHEDIIEYLRPDWIFNTNSMSMSFPDKKKDQNCTSKYSKQIDPIGKCLLDTII